MSPSVVATALRRRVCWEGTIPQRRHGDGAPWLQSEHGDAARGYNRNTAMERRSYNRTRRRSAVATTGRHGDAAPWLQPTQTRRRSAVATTKHDRASSPATGNDTAPPVPSCGANDIAIRRSSARCRPPSRRAARLPCSRADPARNARPADYDLRRIPSGNPPPAARSIASVSGGLPCRGPCPRRRFQQQQRDKPHTTPLEGWTRPRTPTIGACRSSPAGDLA